MALLRRTTRERKLTDFVDQYCDHREACSARCPLRAGKPDRSRIAYVDGYTCSRFRPVDGGTAGAEIRETGVWK